MKKKPPLFKGIIRKGPNYGEKDGRKITSDDVVILKNSSDPTKVRIENPMKIYEKTTRSYFTYDKILGGIVFLLFLIVLLIKFVLNDLFITEVSKNLESLISTLSFAFITSYIFYLIVIKRKEVIRNRETYAVICGLTDSLIENGTHILKLIVKSANREQEVEKLNKIDLDTIERLCELADLSMIEPGNRLDTGQFIIAYGVKKVNFYIEKIYVFMPFLEGEYIKRLSKIQNSSFYREITLLPDLKHYNLKGFSKDIYQYLNLMDDLKIHNEQLKNKYLKNYKKIN